MLTKIPIGIMSAILLAFCLSTTSLAWSLGGSGTDYAGWALDNSGEPFFAIGLWGIPGYTFSRNTTEPEGNDRIYEQVTEPFNTIVMQAGYRKSYMDSSNVLFMSGLSTLNWMLSSEGYSGDIQLAKDSFPTKGATIHFDRMNSIRENAEALRPYLSRTVIPFIEESFNDANLVHFIMDEPDTGRRGWFWPPEVMKTYHDAVHELPGERLTFIGCGGSISGNRYFYEQLFGDVFRIGTDPARGECSLEDMNTYNFAFDGTPQYEYIPGLFGNGRWELKQPSAFTFAFYENVAQTARVYNSACDIIGWNSYTEFRDYPEAAGETVDAIKDACGKSKPVWLFFDGAAYSKPSDMSFGEYAKLITCQVYTSVIHGATGVLFFSFSVPEKYMKLITGLALELGKYSSIFKLPETANHWDTAYHTPGYDHLHYSIRTVPGGKSYLIVSNTDKMSPCSINIEGFPGIEIPPLGIAVIEAE
ncbi:hypothetical protein ACFL50_05245 [Candidatus Latescibacterota bacterium]